jgi:succinylglutamate desuccinylase
MSEWNKEWMRLAEQYARLFQIEPEQTLSALANSQIPLFCFDYIYNAFLNENQIVRLEDLDEAHKEKLKSEAKRLNPDHSNRNIRRVSQVIYIMDLITN